MCKPNTLALRERNYKTNTYKEDDTGEITGVKYVGRDRHKGES